MTRILSVKAQGVTITIWRANGRLLGVVKGNGMRATFDGDPECCGWAMKGEGWNHSPSFDAAHDAAVAAVGGALC